MKALKVFLTFCLLIITLCLIDCLDLRAETPGAGQMTTMSEQEAEATILNSLNNLDDHFTKKRIVYYKDAFIIYTTYLPALFKNPKNIQYECFWNKTKELELNGNSVYFNEPQRDRLLFNSQASARNFINAINSLGQNYSKIIQKECEDCLRQVRDTAAEVILSGATADDLSLPSKQVEKGAVEPVLNDILVEWKTKGLPPRLQSSSSSQLNDMVIQLEKGVLKLDLKAKELKDAADKDARENKDPGDKLQVAHLLEQRKAILIAILGSVKQAAAQKAAAGGSLQPDAAGPNTVVSGPPAQEASPLQRLQAARHLNEQGSQYYNKKQWKLAADAFKAALEKNPDDETIRSNYELASRHLAAEEGRKRPKRQ